jgi:hypothetical protein
MSASRPSPESTGERRRRAGPGFGGLRKAAINPGGTVDAWPKRFWLTLLLLGLCQTADLLTFNMAVRAFGPSGELGPLGLAYEAGGITAVAVAKLGSIFVIMGILAFYPWRRIATRRRLALAIATIGLLGTLTNLLAWM